MPIFGFVFAMVRPCMPPILTSMLVSECSKSWRDEGDIGILFRIFSAILLAWLSATIVTIVDFVIPLVLIYPTVVKLIILEKMLR